MENGNLDINFSSKYQQAICDGGIDCLMQTLKDNLIYKKDVMVVPYDTNIVFLLIGLVRFDINITNVCCSDSYSVEFLENLKHGTPFKITLVDNTHFLFEENDNG